MGRPAKPLITRERAARAALGVIDVQGLEGLNLERVARRIGVKAPSLYHHFKDKTELLQEVARLLLLDIEPLGHDGDWEENLVKLCVAARRSLLRHPNAAPLLLQFFPRHILLSSYEAAASNSGVAPEQLMVLIEGTEKLMFGSTFFEAAARARGVEPMPHFDASQYPNLAKAIRASGFEGEELFIQTIRVFIAGLRQAPVKAKPEESADPAPNAARSRRAKLAV